MIAPTGKSPLCPIYLLGENSPPFSERIKQYNRPYPLHAAGSRNAKRPSSRFPPSGRLPSRHSPHTFTVKRSSRPSINATCIRSFPRSPESSVKFSHSITHLSPSCRNLILSGSDNRPAVNSTFPKSPMVPSPVNAPIFRWTNRLYPFHCRGFSARCQHSFNPALPKARKRRPVTQSALVAPPALPRWTPGCSSATAHTSVPAAGRPQTLPAFRGKHSKYCHSSIP